MHRATLAALSALLLTSAGSLAAQEIRGTVREAGSEQTLSGAVLTVTALDGAVATTITDSAGGFVLPVPPGDSLRLRVERVDYAVLESVPVALGPGEPLELEIHLRRRPIDVGEVRAVARRQRSGFGWYLGEKELTRNPPATATWAMLRLPYVMLYRDRNHAPPRYVLPGRENCAIVLIWTEHALGGQGPSEWPWQGRSSGTD